MLRRALLPMAVFALLPLQGCSALLSLDEFEQADGSGGDAGDGGAPGPLLFNIIFRQSFQPCVECGIWFDWQGVQDNKPKLVVEFRHEGHAYTHTYQHGLLGTENAFGFYLSGEGDSAKHAIMVKQAPRRTGLFLADLSDIPPLAEITKATLYLHIQTTEGFADTDTSSVLSVHQCDRIWSWDHATWSHYDDGAEWAEPGGDFGVFIREIRAKEDLRDRGFSRANPYADFDFTPHVVGLQQRR